MRNDTIVPGLLVVCISILAILFASWWCENLESVSVDSAFVFFLCAIVVWCLSLEGTIRWVWLLPWVGALYFLMFLLAPEEGKGVLINLSLFCEIGGFLVTLGFMFFKMLTSKKEQETPLFVYEAVNLL